MAPLARLRGEAPAVRLNDVVLSWRQLCARLTRWPRDSAPGVNEGEGVLLRAYNQPSALLAWLALLQCGARVLPLNPQLPPSLLAELLPSLDLRYALVLNGDPLALDFTAGAATGGGGFAVAGAKNVWRR
jgi:O-succinylbenzoic acid--CoA ligase